MPENFTNPSNSGTKDAKFVPNHGTRTKKIDIVLHNLITDCMTYRLTEEESLEYIAIRYKKISKRHYYRIKKQLNSDEELQRFFDHHTRIGFIIDHKKRRDEIESVLEQLMRRLLELATQKITNYLALTRLSEAIISANKRAEEISLSNPIISKIKIEIEQLRESEKKHDKDDSYNTSQRKF